MTVVTIDRTSYERLVAIEGAAARLVALLDAETRAAPVGARNSRASPPKTHDRRTELDAVAALRKAVRS